MVNRLANVVTVEESLINNSAKVKFSDLGLSQEVVSVAKEVGYLKPSKIQEQVIPHILEGRDVIAQAETGSGKTAAFAMPILTSIPKSFKSELPIGLVLVPTRELAQQVSESFKKYSSQMPWVKVACIYGGQGYRDQIRALQSKPKIVIGTPGRIIDHIERGFLQLDNVSKLVLDEADEMLKMGFKEDVEFIASKVPEKRQTTLFSATMPPEIMRITKKYLKDPVHVKLASKSLTGKNITQKYWMVDDSKKLEALRRLLITTKSDGIIVFVRTKTQAMEIAEKVNEFGFSAAPLNGDISQSMREKTVARFKAHKFNVLVATDVAARGLDIGRVDLIVNFDIPYEPESYVHRIGRTGRAGNTGEAILFVTKREMTSLKRLERTIKLDIEKGKAPTNQEISLFQFKNLEEKIKNNLAAAKKVKELKIVTEEMEKEGISIQDIASTALYMLSGVSSLDSSPMNKNFDADLDEDLADEDFYNKDRKSFDRRRVRSRGRGQGRFSGKNGSKRPRGGQRSFSKKGA